MTAAFALLLAIAGLSQDADPVDTDKRAWIVEYYLRAKTASLQRLLPACVPDVKTSSKTGSPSSLAGA